MNSASTTAPDCNALPQASAGNDVLGAHLGMLAEEAFKTLACANRAFKVAYQTDSVLKLPPMPDGSLPRTGIIAEANDDSAKAYLIGITGQEKVIVLTHDITFAREQAPSVQSLVRSLTDKYGPAVDINNAGAAIVRSVARDTGGRATKVTSPDFKRCTEAMGWDSDGQFVTQGGCGLTVNYRIDRRSDDPNLVQKLYVIVADQAATIRAVQDIQRAIEKLRASGERPAAPPAQTAGKVPNL